MVANIIISTITGIGSGLLASYFFLVYFLKRKKAKILISPHISKIQYNGEDNYFFKFINKTDTEIFDVRVEATFHKPVGDLGGQNLTGDDIELKDSFFMHIPKEQDNDIYNLHAWRLRTTDPLSDIWTDRSSFIELKIIARHSLSGFYKVFTHTYNSRDCIINGKFRSGNHLDIN